MNEQDIAGILGQYHLGAIREAGRTRKRTWGVDSLSWHVKSGRLPDLPT